MKGGFQILEDRLRSFPTQWKMSNFLRDVVFSGFAVFRRTIFSSQISRRCSPWTRSSRETLRPFGITRNYRGYPQTVRAIALVLEDESRLLNVTEEIYEVVALQTRCHPSNVERNIRTVVLCAWHTNRPLLVKMAGFTLTAPPRASQLLISLPPTSSGSLSDPNRRVLI